MTSGPHATGVEIAAAFHAELVGRVLDRQFPRLRYAAARLGAGSDVLGLDDAESRDHDWGCRLTLLVDEADLEAVPVIEDVLGRELPGEFRGLPVRFATTWDPAVSHRVEVATVGTFAASRLGINPLAGLSTVDWLTLTGQKVLEVTAGPVFTDATAELSLLRETLAWYPPEVERWVLACAWRRITQRLPLVGRTGRTGQARQSMLLAAALVADLTSLAFLLHRRWAPYDKWREAMFNHLPGADALARSLDAACTAVDWQARETALVEAVEVLLEIQRNRGLPTLGHAAMVPFWDRPYRTLADSVVGSLLTGITDPLLIRLPLVGGAEQWVDNVDALTDPRRTTALTAAYHQWLDTARGAR